MILIILMIRIPFNSMLVGQYYQIKNFQFFIIINLVPQNLITLFLNLLMIL